MSHCSPRINALSLACAAGILALGCSAPVIAQVAAEKTNRDDVHTLGTVTATAQ